MLKYAIIGAGGTGGVIGAYMAKAGKDVTLIARGKHLDAVRNSGIKIERPYSGKHETIAVKASAMEEYNEKADVIFVCVKSYSLGDTIPFIKRIAHEKTIVIPILNVYGTGGRMQKDLLPTLPGGKPVLCHHGKTAEEEAIWMAKKIEELHQDGVPYREITILYRAHYLTRTVEEVFLKEKIPYTIYSGIQFFGRMEIKDALSYLRMLAYKDDLSFARIANVPKRNLGERRMAFLREYAEQNQCSLYDALRKNLEHEMMKGTKAASFVSLIENLASNVAERPVSEVLSEILDMSGYEKMLRTEGSQERLDNLAELKQSIYEYETTCGEEATLEYYLTHVALFTNSDLESGKDQVRMMTVHSAKGLEFPYVFLCGMNEGIFPSRKTNTKQAMEEERRLAFVAVTRAEKGLFLTEAEGRNFDGSMRYPSRFLLDIDEKYLTHTEPLAKDRYAEARCYIAGKERYLEEQEKGASFISGDRIQHPIFGKGSILEVDTERGAYLIRFDEMETFRSISIRAKLEKIDF